MKSYILVLSIIFSQFLYSYNSKDINNFYNDYYTGKYNIQNLNGKVNLLTYKNISGLLEAEKITDEKEKYNYLKKLIDENKDYLKSTNVDYLISVAQVMNYTMYYSSVPEKISLGGKSKDIFEKVLKLDSNNFFAILGIAIGYMHAPAIAGGSNSKAFEYFNRALDIANEKYKKYLSLVWLSQYYFKIKDKDNYSKYINMANELYYNTEFLNNAINRNNTKNKPL